MSDTIRKTSPIVAIAAASVITFSAVGVGVMTGIIPSSFSKSNEQAAMATAQPARVEPAAPAPEKKAASHHAAKRLDPPTRVASSEPVRTAAARVCADCGTVSAVNVVEQKGEGTGLGAVAGGVVGGVLGNQVGAGNGRTIATVAGAAGGAYAGHQAEKYIKSTKRYDVAVRMDDGTSRSFSFDHEPAFHPGGKVRVVDGALVAN